MANVGVTEQDRQRLFAALIASEGLSVVEAAKDPRVGVSKAEAYRWLQEEHVRNDIATLLRGHRTHIQSLAAKHIEAAVNTLVAVMTEPNRFSSAQVQAARALLGWAAGGDAPAAAGTTIMVSVNTSLNPDAADEQRRRYEQFHEATFTEKAIEA